MNFDSSKPKNRRILVFTFDINSVQENDFLFTPLIYAFLIDRIRMSEDRERERGEKKTRFETTLLFSVERIAANRGETKVILRSRRPVETRPALNGSVIDYGKTTAVENRLDLWFGACFHA